MMRIVQLLTALPAVIKVFEAIKNMKAQKTKDREAVKELNDRVSDLELRVTLLEGGEDSE